MPETKRMEKPAKSEQEETVQEFPVSRAGKAVVSAAREATDSDIDTAVEEAERDRQRHEALLDEIDNLFKEENPLDLVNQFIQKGGE